MSALAAVMQKFTPVANARRVGPIGLECALSAMHLVQLESDRAGKVTVRARASVPYPCPLDELLASPASMQLLVRKALRSDKFHGHKIVTTLPSTDLQIMPVTYHVGPGQENDAALVAVMAERLDGEFSDYVVDYIPVRAEDNSEERLAIVAVAHRETVINYLEVLRKCGLETEHLEIGPTAIRRLVSALGSANKHENVLAINFGRRSSYFTVVSGSRLLFDQAIQFGEAQLLDRIVSELDMPLETVMQLVRDSSLDPAVAGEVRQDLDIAGTLLQIVKPDFLRLVEEINRTLIYTASQTRGVPVSRIYLLGSLARWQGTDALLRSLIKLDVETIPNPLKPFFTDKRKAGNPGEPAPEIAVATGLAMNGMTEDD
jgi:Tfp pilus assembly PilM family ATPase